MNVENERLLENLRDDAESVKTFASRLLEVAREARMNAQVRDAKGLCVGDFFLDESGHIGVFCGCWTQNMWGTFLDHIHFGYVYPKKRLTHEEAMSFLTKCKKYNKAINGEKV